jgi:hypothetical protein
MGHYPVKSIPNFWSVSSSSFANVSSTDQNNYGYSGVIIDIEVTGTFTGTSLTFTLQGKDPGGTNAYYTLLVSAAVSGTGHTRLVVHPAVTVVANTHASSLLPQTWRLTTTETSMDVITFTASATLIP